MAKQKKQEEKNSQKVSKTGNENEIEVLKAQLARTLADYDNLRRRSDEEKISLLKFSSQSIIIKLLPILDMLESAQEHLNDQGLAIAVLEFKKIFDEEGLVEIKPNLGDVFDENLMEVIEVIEPESNNNLNGGVEFKENEVAEVVLMGWKFKDGNVVRHAKVKVGK